MTTCATCVMDSTISGISFSAQGICNFCLEYEHLAQKPSNTLHAEKIIESIRKQGKGKLYDCIAAVSGGADSSFMLHQLVKTGLRPLAVHYDCGWNTLEATQNIKKLVDKLNIELYTYVVNWEEFRDVQLAYLRAGVIDLEIPTDHSFNAALYKVAALHGIRTIITGQNRVTEYYMPKAWVHDKNDAINLLDIYRKFGNGKQLKTFPLLTLWSKFYYYNLLQIRSIYLLNYMDYPKSEALELLRTEYGWAPLWVKHGENVWTRFYQCFILPTRFGVDKRKAHLSNLVASGQMSRKEALKALEEPIYSGDLRADREYVLKKFEINKQEFHEFMCQPIREHSQFRTEEAWKMAYTKLRRMPVFSRLFGTSGRH